jgi:CSLREA domain-containing protein
MLVCGPVASAEATNIVVTTELDELGNSAECSLRAAIKAANADLAVDACPAGSGSDAIALGPHKYEITLANAGGKGEDANATGDFDITGPVTISGVSLSQTTVDGGGLDRVLDIHEGVVTVSSLLIYHGGSADTFLEDGAGIRSAGDLTVSDSLLFGNGNLGNGHIVNGGAIASSGVLMMIGDRVEDNAAKQGGGVYSTGALDIKETTFKRDFGSFSGGGLRVTGETTLTDTTITEGESEEGGGFTSSVAAGTKVALTRVTITKNEGERFGGGGIYATGPLTVSQSTIEHNIARSFSKWEPGGGIFMKSGPLTVSESTIDGNEASDGDGLYLAEGAAATLTNDTLHENGSSTSGGSGGGLYVAGGATATLLSDTLAANSAGSHAEGGNIYNAGVVSAKDTLAVYADGNCFGVPVVSEGHNDDFVSAEIVAPCFTGSTDVRVDPQLGPLQANGGPTMTRALPAASPVVDAGTGCAAFDQRGFFRPQGSACDLGAYELLQSFPLTVTLAGNGSVASSPAGIACPSDCSETYTGGPVTLTATPASGFTFAGWTGACSGVGPCTVMMSAARAVTANFTIVNGAAAGTESTLGGGNVLGVGSSPLASLSALRLTPGAFVAAPGGPSAKATGAKKRKYGAIVRYNLNEQALVRFTVNQVMPGRMSGTHKKGRCVPQTNTNRAAKRCTRLRALSGSLSRSSRAGANSFRFTGRIGGKTLKPGAYILVATPTANGRTGAAVNARFRVTR